METITRHALLLMAVLAASPADAADGWSTYSNPRFGYTAAVPPGFTPSQEADNGDGATFRGGDGQSTLSIYGTMTEGGDLAAEAHKRIGRDKERGWNITYHRVTSGWVSYSGFRSSNILYVRGIALCDGSAAYFHLEYPRGAVKQFNTLIARMITSLHPASGCNLAPKNAPGAAQN